MGKTFRLISLCHTNDFDNKRNEKIKGWVENNGGVYSRTITPEVTHLVASKTAWRIQHPLVKAALKQKGTAIVNIDWLEDSLLSRSRKPKAVARYEWSPRRQQTLKFAKNVPVGKTTKPESGSDAVKKERTKEKSKVEDAGQRFDKECRAFEREMAAAGHHPYADENQFRYLVTLVRNDIAKTRIEQYRVKVRYAPFFSAGVLTCPVPLYYFPKPGPFSSHPVAVAKARKKYALSNPKLRVPIGNPWAQSLQIYESDALPHTYACYALYSNKGQKCERVPLVERGSFEFAFQCFRKFFQRRTAVEWQRRIDPGAGAREAGMDGAQDVFAYQVPSDDQPKIPIHHRSARTARKPSMTMVINAAEAVGGDLDARAHTPEGGW